MLICPNRNFAFFYYLLDVVYNLIDSCSRLDGLDNSRRVGSNPGRLIGSSTIFCCSTDNFDYSSSLNTSRLKRRNRSTKRLVANELHSLPTSISACTAPPVTTLVITEPLIGIHPTIALMSAVTFCTCW